MSDDSPPWSVPDSELAIIAIRAQGAGGQNVNKVSSAIHLRFDVRASSLPPATKLKLLAIRDRRLNQDGVIVIKSQRFRTQEKNRADAKEKLLELIRRATAVRKTRKPSRPTFAARRRRLDSKRKQGQKKELRGKVSE